MDSTAEAKAKFPLLEEDQIQAALWDPDAGLVIPRSQTVCAELTRAHEWTTPYRQVVVGSRHTGGKRAGPDLPPRPSSAAQPPAPSELTEIN